MSKIEISTDIPEFKLGLTVACIQKSSAGGKQGEREETQKEQREERDWEDVDH